MSRLKYKKSRVYRSELKESLVKCFGDKYEVDDVLDFLCGNGCDYPIGHYDVIKHPSVKTSAIQRFNCFWVYPIMLVVVCPIKWLFTGRSGFGTDSKPYEILQFLLGDVK